MFFREPVHYEGTVIRPPSEAESLIIQATLGCSDNRCVFCPAYKDKPFRIKNIEVVEAELAAAARVWPDTQRIFFADGDAVTLPQEHLIRLLESAARYFPKLARVAMYASVKSLETKTVDELRQLRARKLGILYLGFETGDPDVYRMIRKYGSPAGNIAACKKVKDAGIKTNVTVILGLGGKERSQAHAENTASILNEAQPHQIAALTLMIAPGTPLAEIRSAGTFVQPDEFGMLAELKIIVEHLKDFPCLFFANHASNYYPVQARFPRERQAVLAELSRIIDRKQKSVLRPDFLRGL